jgi:hypothetical protein
MCLAVSITMVNSEMALADRSSIDLFNLHNKDTTDMYYVKRATNDVFGENTVHITSIRAKFSTGEYSILIGRRDGKDAVNRKTFFVGTSTLERKKRDIMYCQVINKNGKQVLKNEGEMFHIDNIIHVRDGKIVWRLNHQYIEDRRSVWLVTFPK